MSHAPPSRHDFHLGRASLTAAAAAGLLRGASFLIVALLCHWLSPAELGVYRQVIIIQALPALLLSMGGPEGMLYALGQTRDAQVQGRIFAAGCLWMVLLMPALGLSSAGLVLLASRLLDRPQLADAAAAAAWLGAFNVYLLFAAPVFIGRRKPGHYLLFAGAQLATGTGLTALLTWQSPTLSAALLAAILTAAQGCCLTLLAFVLVARPGPLAELWKQHVVPGLRYGWPTALGGFLSLAGYQVDHLVASLLFSATDYGLYAGGAWQLPVGSLAHHGQATTLLPVMAGHYQANRRQAFWADWHRLVRPAGIAGAFLFWGVFWTAADIIRLVLGPAYDASVAVFRVYVWLLPLRVAAIYLPLRATGSTRAEIGAGLVLGVVSLVVGLALGPHLGLVGPALGVVAGMCAWATYLLLATIRTLKVSLVQLLPVSALATSLVIAGGIAALCFAVVGRALREPSGQRLAIFWGLYTAVALMVWKLMHCPPRGRT